MDFKDGIVRVSLGIGVLGVDGSACSLLKSGEDDDDELSSIGLQR